MSENPLRDEAERRGQQDSLVFAAVTLVPGGSATAAKVTQAPFVLERLTFDIFEIVERRMMVPHAETFEVIVPRKERRPRDRAVRTETRWVMRAESYHRVRRVRHVNSLLVTQIMVGSRSVFADHVPVPIGSVRAMGGGCKAGAGWTIQLNLSNRTMRASYDVIVTALGKFFDPE